MDPLSITASVLTLLSAAGVVLRELEQLRSRMNPDAEFLMLMNAITDVQVTLTTVRDCADTLRNSKAPAAQQSYRNLPYAIDRVQVSLDRLVDFIRESLLRKGNRRSRLGLSESKKRKLSELRGVVSEAHQNLRLILLSANLRQSPALLSAIEEAVILQNDHHVKTSATLEQIVTQLTALENRKLEGTRSSQEGKETSVALDDPVLRQKQLMQLNDSATSNQLRITTSVPLKQCDPSCNCQCHVRTQYRTPQWLSAVAGTLFYSSSINPALDRRPCNSTKCLRSEPTSSSRFTYYFPTWMMRSAMVYSTWGNLDGMNSSWVVRMPREIDVTSPCWYYINQGFDYKIRDLLQRREMSPYDIDHDGSSVLTWALDAFELDICSLLVAVGADWHIKNRNGISPADIAWVKILRGQPTDPDVIELRALVGSEDLFDFSLNPIHRAIVGLSSADIREQINLEPSRINERDWTGKSPLMWAALRADHVTVQLLLSHHACVGLRDLDGKTALHYAAQAGSFQCVKQLLDAGADPNAASLNGKTPLHLTMTTRLRQPLLEELILQLKNHNADIEARDNDGWTPLFRAVDEGSHSGIKALAKCGADVNALSYRGLTPISSAIFNSEYEVIETLCNLGAHLRRVTTLHPLDNVFKYVACYGTVEAMNTLADSDAQCIDYDPEDMKNWFINYRNDEYILGRRFPPDEERAAFQNLLDKKGNKIESSAQSWTQDEDTWQENEEIDQDIDDEEQTELFEDALESISQSIETIIVEGPANPLTVSP